MKEKVLKLLELSDAESNINTILEKFVNENSIDIYVDYRDFKYVASEVVNYKTRDEFEDAIIESYDNYVIDEMRDLAMKAIDLVKNAYPNYDGLSDSLEEFIYEFVNEHVEVNYPFEQYLKHELRVNFLVTYDKSTDAETDDLDYKTLCKVLKKFNYVQPKTIIKEIIKDEYDKNDKFLKSIREEIVNSYPTQFNYLTFIGTISVDEYYTFMENPRKCTVFFTSKTMGGFFDPYNGGGSVLGIDLPSELKVRGDSIYKLLVEDAKNGCYTVDDTYGLTSQCFQPIKLVKGVR